MVAMISADAYSFLAFSDLTCHLYRNRCFVVAPSHLIVRRANLEVATKTYKKDVKQITLNHTTLCNLALQMFEAFV